jgi:hypothetical protein
VRSAQYPQGDPAPVARGVRPSLILPGGRGQGDVAPSDQIEQAQGHV